MNRETVRYEVTDGVLVLTLTRPENLNAFTVQMADVGTTRMETLLTRLRAQTDSIFQPEKYKVTFTGTLPSGCTIGLP